MPASSFPGPGFDAVIFDTDGFVTNVQVLRLLALRLAAWRRSPTARPDRMCSGPPAKHPVPARDDASASGGHLTACPGSPNTPGIRWIRGWRATTVLR
jgi:hypothetical protein